MTYDQPITIQTMNSSGVWSNLGTMKARVNRSSGSESDSGGSEQAKEQLEFVTPYFTALGVLDPRTTRIIFRGNNYDLTEPPDNFMLKNRTLKFRAVRRYGR